MPAAADIAEHLEDNVIGTVGTSIFVNYLPETPDACIAVYDTGGQAPLNVLNYENAGIQVTVRGTAAAGRSKIADVFDLLHTLTHATIETRDYRRIDATSSPSFIGRDRLGRSLFTVNFIVLKEVE